MLIKGTSELSEEKQSICSWGAVSAETKELDLNKGEGWCSGIVLGISKSPLLFNLQHLQWSSDLSSLGNPDQGSLGWGWDGAPFSGPRIPSKTGTPKSILEKEPIKTASKKDELKLWIITSVWKGIKRATSLKGELHVCVLWAIYFTAHSWFLVIFEIERQKKKKPKLRGKGQKL